MSTDSHTRSSSENPVRAAVSMTLPAGTVGTLSLRRMVKKSCRQVQEVYHRAEQFVPESSSLSDAFLWLTDNDSFLEEEYRILWHRLRGFFRLHACGSVPFCFAAALQLCRLNEGLISPRQVTELVVCCDEAVPGGMDYEEASLFPLLVRAASLVYLGELCHEFLGRSLFVADREEQTLINAIRTVKFLTVCDYREGLEQCRAETLLREDPSGLYPQMTDASRAELRRMIHQKASREHLPDTALIRDMLKKAAAGKSQKERYVGHYLPRPRRYGGLYFGCLFAASLLLTGIFAYFTAWYFFPLFFFPIFECSKFILDTLFSRFFRGSNLLPALELSEIPDSAPTLCVITTLLQGSEKDAPLFARLERIYNANSGRNVQFGILADLGDSSHATESRDDGILEYARGRIESLNAKYGHHFILFVRSRSYSKSEHAFMAYERKRGAVMELVRLIHGEKTGFDLNMKSLAQQLPFLHKVRYVITLDADTNLGLDAVKLLVGKMLHPENRPVIHPETSTVVEGYGMMQPRMSPELSCARATPFSRLLCGGGGVDIYSGACFDLYQSLFQAGIFCGKGIFDADAFYQVIDQSGVFPEDAILSHDILEGERLRTALLCDVEMTDGFPKNELSFLKRRHRWIRGDIQNLRFAGRTISLPTGEKKKGFSPLSRFKLLDNARRAVTPVFSLALLLCGFLQPDRSSLLALCAFSPYILPFLSDTLGLIRTLAFKSAARKFFSRGVTVGLWQSFLRMLFFEAMLAKDALLSLGAVFTSLYRMCISKRKLLEWVTAAQSDSGKPTLTLFISKHIVSAALGVFLLLFAPGGLIKLAGLAFFLMPLLGWFSCKDRSRKPVLSSRNKARLSVYARDIWKFFKETVTPAENFLPPDNLQLSPHEKTARRTSPTNIGLYLVSILAARDMGLIDTPELLNRVRNTLDTVCRLPKWHGNLYNWYRTDTLAVLAPSYISSVDSGNFLACLITLRSGLADYTHEEPALLEQINRVAQLMDETDLSVLYNPRRSLFSVGVRIDGQNGTQDESCYDFLMSEARILSYVSVSSRKVPRQHWQTLARPLISSHGYIGLASWSGTAFEYFMPDLFMPIRKGSLMYEAMLFACKAQRERRALGVWGISESGYFAFDCDLNYQYKAFGIPKLGQKPDLKDDLVISPYSSFLTLCISVEKSLQNLSELTKLGLYGKYGFYEACDFTRSRVKSGYAPVKSYMSHHLGMSFLALANATNDGCVLRRFMQDTHMACGSELLEERIPVDAVIRRQKSPRVPKIRREKPFTDPSVTLSEPSFSSPRSACISDGKASLTVSDCGHVRITKGELHLTESGMETHRRPASLYCYVKTGKETFGLSPLAQGSMNLNSSGQTPDSSENTVFSLSYSESSITQTCTLSDTQSYTLDYTLSPHNRSLLRVRFSAKSHETCELCFFFYPILTDKKAFDAHPAFSGLFVEAIFDAESKILFYKRRPRSEHEEESWLAVAFSDKNREFFFETRESDLERFPYSDPFSHHCSCHTGACLSPAAQLRITAPEGKAELFLVLTHDRESAALAVEQARNESFSQVRGALSEAASQFVLGAGISSVGRDGTVCRMLSSLCFGQNGGDCFRWEKLFTKESLSISRNQLWKHGISGDNRLLLLDAGGCYFPTPIENTLRAFKLLTMKNVRCDLVILFGELDRYEQKTRKKLQKIITSCGVEGYLGRGSGGIHLIEQNGATEEEIQTLRYVAVGCIDANAAPAEKNSTPAPVHRLMLPVESPRFAPEDETEGFRVRGGRFCADGFSVNKEEASLPFTHVLSGENISTVVTQNSLGYTFYKNASQMRITPYNGRLSHEGGGEHLFYEENGQVYDLIACSHTVLFSCGKAEYRGKAGRLIYRITVTCSVKLPRKCISVSFSGAPAQASLFYRVIPCMGHVGEPFAKQQSSPTQVLFKNPLSESFSHYTGFLSVSSSCLSPKIPPSAFALCGGTLTLSEGSAVFYLGAAYDHARFGELLTQPTTEDAPGFAKSLLPALRMIPGNSSDPELALQKMFGTYLPYSAIFSRMLARSGYYQSGGAYGFRDQLQDCMLLFYSDARRALAHILRAAAHQFPEGDVLHWWHPQGNRGVRTRCSDDYLWLVFVCCEYAELFGTCAFLDIPVPYIDGSPLPPEKAEDYIAVTKSELTEPLFQHCLRALQRALKLTGEHGLCLMGSCDWCDGYSLVGRNGKGESVWVTMFLAGILRRFAVLCEKKDMSQQADSFRASAEILTQAVMKHGYDADSRTFLRGYYDDGTPLGSFSSPACKVDILPQGFASYSGVCSPEVAAEALIKAYDTLYDKTYRILRLFTPPFENEKENPGYIKGYLPGIRENGGQYTHGALFGALGCFDCAEKLSRVNPALASKLSRMGGEILLSSNPAYRCCPSAPDCVRQSYQTEPYAIAADIYANPDHMGRGGWTHYTGAAGWYYRLTLRYVFGLRFENVSENPALYIDPLYPFPLPELLAGTTLEVKVFGFHLSVKYVADGKKVVTTGGIPADLPLRRNTITVEVHF